MFKRSRIKIIVAIMAALLLFLLVMVGTIYGTSYRELTKENREMLEQYSESFDLFQALKEAGEGPGMPMIPVYPYDANPSLHSGPEGGMEPPGPKDDRGQHAFAISSFYYTALDSDGEPIVTSCGNGSVYTDEDILEMACQALESGKTQGSAGDLIYRITDKGDYTLVAFMDNTVVRSSMETFLKYTLISFAIAAPIVLLLALFLSKKIIGPLEENDQRQKQFVSDAGHELKTPIAVMSTNLELLSREVGADNQWLANAQYENERMSTLVKQLLELSHAENGASEHQDLDFSNLITGETLPFESIAFEHGLTLNSDITRGIHVSGNSGQLKQLTAILLDNAISHSEGGDTVDIRLTSDRHQAVLEVTNSGREIPREVRDKLFERFYRPDEARTENGSGHYGLGLAIAKAIVQAHAGAIGIDCAEGKVTFRVNLPLK